MNREAIKNIREELMKHKNYGTERRKIVQIVMAMKMLLDELDKASHLGICETCKQKLDYSTANECMYECRCCICEARFFTDNKREVACEDCGEQNDD